MTDFKSIFFVKLCDQKTKHELAKLYDSLLEQITLRS